MLPDETVAFRKYGSSLAIDGTKEEQFDQATKSLDQIYGFILCERFGLKPESLFERAVDLWREYPKVEAPNFIISLQDGFIRPLDLSKNQFVCSILDGNAVVFSADAPNAFGSLIAQLNHIVRIGRTVEVQRLGNYFLRPGSKSPMSLIQGL